MLKQLLIFLLIGVMQCSFAQDGEYYYQQANQEFEGKNYKKSIELIDVGIRMNPYYAALYNLKANCYIRLSDLNTAISVYAQGISILPENSFLYFDRALLFNEMHQYRWAIQDYTSALKFLAADDDTNRASFLTNRGMAKANIRDLDGAKQDLTIALKIQPDNFKVLTNLAIVCTQQGDGEKGLDYLFRALAVDSTELTIYHNIGYTYQKIGKYKKAIHYFNYVLKREPKEAFTLNNRAYCKLKINEPKAAMKDVKASLKINPTNSYAYRNRALIYIKMGKKKKACQDIDRAIKYGYTQQYGDDVEEIHNTYCNH